MKHNSIIQLILLTNLLVSSPVNAGLLDKLVCLLDGSHQSKTVTHKPVSNQKIFAAEELFYKGSKNPASSHPSMLSPISGADLQAKVQKDGYEIVSELPYPNRETQRKIYDLFLDKNGVSPNLEVYRTKSGRWVTVSTRADPQTGRTYLVDLSAENGFPDEFLQFLEQRYKYLERKFGKPSSEVTRGRRNFMELDGEEPIISVSVRAKAPFSNRFHTDAGRDVKMIDNINLEAGGGTYSYTADGRVIELPPERGMLITSETNPWGAPDNIHASPPPENAGERVFMRFSYLPESWYQ